MTKKKLIISVGQHSSKGRKTTNQDFHGVSIPDDGLLKTKGIAIAIADGISTSDVSQVASQTAIKSFLEDYYCTSETWSVKVSAQRVLSATSSWLYAQTQRSQHRHNKDKGYVCTFTSLILKSNTAHIFHIGDARVYRISNNSVDILTEEHRAWLSSEKSYLSRALGISQKLEIDYQSLPFELGDIFLLCTDGIYESLSSDEITTTINQHLDDLDKGAKAIIDQAYENGSDDNLTVQIVRIDELPTQEAGEIYKQLTTLPFPPKLESRTTFDGYEIIRDIYISSRSHVVLARDTETNTQVALKAPSVEQRNDPAYLERFLLEEWIAKRLNNAHILKAFIKSRKRNYLYTVTEYIEGQTLAQWMIDNPKPNVDEVRTIIEQVAKGLRAFHRQEMLHQDLRPNNIIIDKTGTVKIIDFGSAYVAGLEEIETPLTHNFILGTAQFTAPEYFLGEHGTRRSDLYSLGVITYQMLSGKMPYGTAVAKARTRLAQRNLIYQSTLNEKREIPIWVDETLKKAVHPDPLKRYSELSEFVHDLKQPNPLFVNKAREPLLKRDPVLFWQGVSFVLFVLLMYSVLN